MTKDEKEQALKALERVRREEKYRNEYQKENYKRVVVCFKKDEFAIMDGNLPEGCKNMSEYIKSLVNADLQERGII